MWRVLGVAFVLLCVGVIGGYAVAERSAGEPVSSEQAVPVPAESPSVPTPPVRTILPNPETLPLEPDLPASPEELRPTPRAAGVRVDIPDDWGEPIQDSTMWNAVKDGNPKNTYLLRITLVRAQNVSVTAAKTGRIATLEEADSNGGIEDFEVTDQTDDTFEATYIDGGYLRVTMEKFISFDGSHAYASAAVTGRAEDREGLRDLLSRTIDSMQPLPAKPRPDKSDADQPEAN
ncbi:hypothetical protein [uncultured Nocardioides sp.]|uniref:hypothetical protein n=1 Tax=uncultured Nocardioides sp. TaxID=198441 RepID=UPI00262334A4|nr:hypothetical protein [uncultured Nocardioides sp.]